MKDKIAKFLAKKYVRPVALITVAVVLPLMGVTVPEEVKIFLSTMFIA